MVEAAYEAHRSQLIRYLTRVTRDASTAEDLVQDAFVRLTIEVIRGACPRRHRRVAASRRPQPRDEPRAAAVGCRQAPLELALPDQPQSPEQLALASERHREVQDAVSDLEAVHRYALLMAAMGYGGIDIARSIGRTEAATRTMLCRVRAKVRTRLTAVQPIAP